MSGSEETNERSKNFAHSPSTRLNTQWLANPTEFLTNGISLVTSGSLRLLSLRRGQSHDLFYEEIAQPWKGHGGTTYIQPFPASPDGSTSRAQNENINPNLAY